MLRPPSASDILDNVHTGGGQTLHLIVFGSPQSEGVTLRELASVAKQCSLYQMGLIDKHCTTILKLLLEFPSRQPASSNATQQVSFTLDDIIYFFGEAAPIRFVIPSRPYSPDWLGVCLLDMYFGEQSTTKQRSYRK